VKRTTVGSRVKYSSKFIRSIGNVGVWRAEVIGTVIDVFRQNGFDLALVEWSEGGHSEVNIVNLVALADVEKEARATEHRDAVPGLVIGSNAYAKL